MGMDMINGKDEFLSIELCGFFIIVGMILNAQTKRKTNMAFEGGKKQDLENVYKPIMRQYYW